MAPSAFLQTVALILAVCVSFTTAMPPSVLAITGQGREAPQEELIGRSPSREGARLPAGGRERSEGISYTNSGDRNVLEVVEGADRVTIVEDELTGGYVIRVPEQQILRRERCPYLHVYIAEVDMCVRAWPRFRYEPRVFQYPSLAALVRP